MIYYIVTRYIALRYIEIKYTGVMLMDNRIKRVYIPMSETAFYILFCLQQERHGYNITQKVKELTDNEVIITPGTMYGTLSKMEKDGLICFVREEDKRKLYRITDLGKEILDIEIRRIYRLYRNVRGEEK